MCLVCVSDVELFGWIYGNGRKKAHLSKSTTFLLQLTNFRHDKTNEFKEFRIFLINLFFLGFSDVHLLISTASNIICLFTILFVVVVYQVIDSDKMSGNGISSMCMNFVFK